MKPGDVYWANLPGGGGYSQAGRRPVIVVQGVAASDTTMPVSWDSGTLGVGAQFSFVFSAAGKYTYHCSFHQSLGMVGTISVPVKASPPSGPAGTVFTIVVASANATGTLVYDIQKKNPGDQIVTLKVMIGPSSDPELAAFLEKWAPQHPFDPRQGMPTG